MTNIFLHSFLFLFIFYSHGLIFLKKLLKTKTNYNFFEICLIGLIVTLIISPFINLFIPLNNLFILLNLSFLILFFIYNKDIFFENIKFNYKLFILLFSLVLLNIYGSGFSDDLDHYHYGFITNSDELNTILGNSFLHPLYGTSPIWLTGHSFFNFDHSRLTDIHILNGLLLFLILSTFINELFFDNKINNFFKKFLFSIILFIVIKYSRIKEFGIDKPAILLFCFLIYCYLKFFFINKKSNEISNNFIILFLISITIISIKIIYVPILILPILIFFKQQKKINLRQNYIFIFIPISIFLIKNLSSSGCLIFPFEFTCLKFLPWSNYAGSVEFTFYNEVFNKSWTSYKGDLSEVEYIKNFNWFMTWLERGKIEILEYFFTLTFITFITYFIFKGGEKINVKFNILKISFVLIVVFSLLIYFIKNPVLRMNHHIFISLMLLFLLFYKSKKKFIRFKFLAKYVLILAIMFNITKNFNRIYANDFRNNSYEAISHKITKPQKKFLGDLEYYIGWYGKAPMGNQNLANKNYKEVYFFKVIY